MQTRLWVLEAINHSLEAAVTMGVAHMFFRLRLRLRADRREQGSSSRTLFGRTKAIKRTRPQASRIRSSGRARTGMEGAVARVRIWTGVAAVKGARAGRQNAKTINYSKFSYSVRAIARRSASVKRPSFTPRLANWRSNGGQGNERSRSKGDGQMAPARTKSRRRA